MSTSVSSPAAAPEYCTEQMMQSSWDYIYWSGRWHYYEAAIEVLASVITRGPVLEVGPYTCPLVRNATYMDIAHYGLGVVRHDAGEPAWPFFRLGFEAVVALQVVEHLGSRQPTFFSEAARVARQAVLVSVPWQWSCPGDHGSIDRETVLRWTGGVDWMGDGRLVGPPGRQRMILAFAAPALRARR